LRHKHTLFPRRPVSKIILLPKLSRALILSGESCDQQVQLLLNESPCVSDGTLHPLNLPSLKPVPSTVMTPLRGVISVILNDDELDWNRPGSEDKSGEMTIVVVRRKGMGIYRLGSRLTATKVRCATVTQSCVSSRSRRYPFHPLLRITLCSRLTCAPRYHPPTRTVS